MKDAFGKQLNVGDTVIYVDASRSGYNIRLATIVKFTPKMVRLSADCIRMPHDIVKYGDNNEN